MVVPRKKMWAAILEDYVAKKAEEFVEDTLIPDLVLEVLNENSQKRNYDLYSTKFRGEIQYIEGFVERVVQKMAREAVQETISGIAGE